jgi:hypothetical protein
MRDCARYQPNGDQRGDEHAVVPATPRARSGGAAPSDHASGTSIKYLAPAAAPTAAGRRRQRRSRRAPTGHAEQDQGQDLPGSRGICCLSFPPCSGTAESAARPAGWRGRPGSATCSCRSRGDAGTPPRRAQRHGDWFTGALPAEPVVLCSQTANAS